MNLIYADKSLQVEMRKMTIIFDGRAECRACASITNIVFAFSRPAIVRRCPLMAFAVTMLTSACVMDLGGVLCTWTLDRAAALARYGPAVAVCQRCWVVLASFFCQGTVKCGVQVRGASALI